MKLYCMRHGEAIAMKLGSERSLTESGREAVRRAALNLVKIQASIAQIIHSDTLRTRQTAEIVANALKMSTMTAAAVLLGENGDVNMLCDMLPAWQDNTLLVGHFPFMTQLVKVLADVDVKFRTATIVCLMRDDKDNWKVEWVY